MNTRNATETEIVEIDDIKGIDGLGYSFNSFCSLRTDLTEYKNDSGTVAKGFSRNGVLWRDDKIGSGDSVDGASCDLNSFGSFAIGLTKTS